MGKILIVDDDPSIRAKLREVLELEVFHVSEAGDGPAALKAFNSDTPDAVLLDLSMPGMDGMEVFHELKQLDPRIPVVILTGHGDTPTAVDAVKRGVYDFITKPPDFDKLVTTMKNAVEKKVNAQPRLPLTSRQAEVLKLTASGKSISEISKILELGEDAVNFHISNAKNKLGAKNKSHAIAKAIQLGLIDTDDTE